MPDKKLTDIEIVKAWIVVLENKRMPTEHLINVTIDRINSLTADVFRQQAEINVKNRLLDEAKAEIEKNENIIKLADKTIETANAEIEALINGRETLQKYIAEQNAEIERLKVENKLLIDNDVSNKYPNCVLVEKGRIYTRTLEDYDELIGDISADGIKEFVERLKNEIDIRPTHSKKAK